MGGRPPSAAVAAVAAVEMGEVAAALAVKAVTDTNVLVEETRMGEVVRVAVVADPAVVVTVETVETVALVLPGGAPWVPPNALASPAHRPVSWVYRERGGWGGQGAAGGRHVVAQGGVRQGGVREGPCHICMATAGLLTATFITPTVLTIMLLLPQ